MDVQWYIRLNYRLTLIFLSNHHFRSIMIIAVSNKFWYRDPKEIARPLSRYERADTVKWSKFKRVFSSLGSQLTIIFSFLPVKRNMFLFYFYQREAIL